METEELPYYGEARDFQENEQREEASVRPDSQLEWVKAARRFKAAALVMSDLWSELDEEAQGNELCVDYPFTAAKLEQQGESFDEGPLTGIMEWLNTEKLDEIERRACMVVCDGFPTCETCNCTGATFPWTCPVCSRDFDADKHPLCVDCNEPLFVSTLEAPGVCRGPLCFSGVGDEKTLVLASSCPTEGGE